MLGYGHIVYYGIIPATLLFHGSAMSNRTYHSGHYTATSSDDVFHANPENNSIWEWYITAQNPMKKIQLSLKVKGLNESSNCHDNYMQVFDGSSVFSKSIAKFCDLNTHLYTSSGSDIVIKLQIDYSEEETDLLIMFTEVNPGILEVCGFGMTEYTATHLDQYIESPYFTNTAYYSLRIITGDSASNYVIHLDVDIWKTEMCDGGYIEAFDDYNCRNSLGKWCNSGIRTYESSGKYMVLVFHAGVILQKSVFQMKYKLKYHKPSPSTTGPIVGGVLGSIAFIALLVCFVVYYKRKHNNFAAKRMSVNEKKESI